MSDTTLRERVVIRSAVAADLSDVMSFLEPYIAQQQILQRSSDELARLLAHGFIAEHEGDVIGFAAVEPYSRKLAELQCLAVAEEYRRLGVGSTLIRHCVARARQLGVHELMAITSSEEPFRACGFDYALPQQKRALFVHP